MPGFVFGFGRLGWGAGLVLTMIAIAPVHAQISINAGRTPAQIYAMQCETCHDKPQTLAKAPPARLTEFLREHYTESRETAAVLADYLLRRASNAPEPRSATRRRGGEAPSVDQARDTEPRATSRSGNRRGGDKSEPKSPDVKPLGDADKERPSADSVSTPAVESRPEPQIEPVTQPESGSAETKPAETTPTEDASSDAKSSSNTSSESEKTSSESDPSENSASDSKASEAPSGSRSSEAKPPEMPMAEPKAANTNSDSKSSE
jgi:hypothetical protein